MTERERERERERVGVQKKIKLEVELDWHTTLLDKRSNERNKSSVSGWR